MAKLRGPRRATSSDADKRQIGTGRFWAPTGWSEVASSGRPVSGPGSSVSRWWPVRHCTLQSSVSRTYSALGAATVAVPVRWLQRLLIGRGAWLAVNPNGAGACAARRSRGPSAALGAAQARMQLGPLLRDPAGGPHHPADLGGRGQKAWKAMLQWQKQLSHPRAA
jgi:hypothetical protein